MKRKEVFISFILACGLAALPLNVSAQKRLSAEEARQEERVQVEKWMGEVSGVYGAMWRSKVFTLDSLRMPIMYKVFGEKPADGRSLYISMHGGGSTPTAVNDQQWRNQIVLYAPKEGVYVAPRAPFDDWNMWFRPQMDAFFQQLIAAAVVEMDVNPDEVYLLGYSAGGDGVWRMAPRMADRWAAASMMAGHPGEASQLNLRNVPFMIWMGENDGAYNRNRLAAEKGAVMDSLHAADPAGYVHETHIVAGKGHGMDRADTLAIAWMAKYRRNVVPERVVWRQEETVRPSMYWLKVDVSKARPGMEIVASRKGNRIVVERCDYPSFTLCLNDDVADLDKPVIVEYNGRRLLKKRVRRSADTIARSLRERQDPRLIFSAELEVRMPD